MAKIGQFVFNHFGVNCYVVEDEESGACAVVDPAAEEDYEKRKLFDYLDRGKRHLEMILLTHAHVDHICGLREVCAHYQLPVSLHREGVALLRQAAAYGSMMGFDVEAMDDLPMRFLEDDEKLQLGKTELESRYVPGHCPGSLCYVLPEERVVFTGDALFAMSIGRTDLPGGNYETLISKLKERILVLTDDYKIYPGHGESSSIGDERRYNSFLV